MLVSGGGKKSSGLWVSKVLLLFRIVGRGINGCREHAIWQSMEERSPIDRVDETLGCVCQRWSTGGEVDNRLKRGTGISKQEGLSVEEWFRMDRLETL